METSIIYPGDRWKEWGDTRLEEETLKITGNHVCLVWEAFIYTKLCWNTVNNSWLANIYTILKVKMFLFIFLFVKEWKFYYVVGEMSGHEQNGNCLKSLGYCAGIMAYCRRDLSCGCLPGVYPFSVLITSRSIEICNPFITITFLILWTFSHALGCPLETHSWSPEINKKDLTWPK